MSNDSNHSSIIVRPSIFDESYVPDIIEARTKQMEQMKACLEPVKRRVKPLNCWTCGPSGSGKTCAVRLVLTNAEKSHSLAWAYVNCWETPTPYLVLDELVRQLRILGADVQATNIKLHAVEQHLRGRPFVIIIDELDMASPKERSAILYNLVLLESVGLFCITTNDHALNELDPRVKSRLNPVVVSMPSYTEEEIIGILRQRAETGLLPESWSEESLKTIASLANGNARVAIQTLRSAGLLAEKRRARKLLPVDIDLAHASAANTREHDTFNGLTPHHRLLYEIVASQGVVASSELWREYLKRCKARKIPSIAPRTYTQYVRRLIEMGVIQEEFVIQKGRKRLFRVARPIGAG